jgi:hypothetical protein
MFCHFSWFKGLQIIISGLFYKQAVRAITMMQCFKDRTHSGLLFYLKGGKA